MTYNRKLYYATQQVVHTSNHTNESNHKTCINNHGNYETTEHGNDNDTADKVDHTDNTTNTSNYTDKLILYIIMVMT